MPLLVWVSSLPPLLGVVEVGGHPRDGVPHQVHQVHIQPQTPPVKIEEMVGKERGLWQARDVASQHLFDRIQKRFCQILFEFFFKLYLCIVLAIIVVDQHLFFAFPPVDIITSVSSSSSSLLPQVLST